jgi:hypothetical protein
VIKVVSKTKEIKYTHIGINIGTMPLNRLSILVNDELGEVPLDEAAKQEQNHKLHMKNIYTSTFLLQS